MKSLLVKLSALCVAIVAAMGLAACSDDDENINLYAIDSTVLDTVNDIPSQGLQSIDNAFIKEFGALEFRLQGDTYMCDMEARTRFERVANSVNISGLAVVVEYTLSRTTASTGGVHKEDVLAKFTFSPTAE